MPAVGAGALEAWGAVSAWAGTAAGSAAIGAVGAGVAGAAASKLLAPKPPPMPTAPPVLQAPDGTAAAGAVANRARGAAGFGSTNLTGPMGLTDPATTAPKTLLGG